MLIQSSLRGVSSSRSVSAMALLAVVGVLVEAGPAAAQSRTVVAARSQSSAKPVVAPKPVAPFPMMAVVSVGSQRVAIYDSSGAVMHAPVSTGQAGHRTPLGVFSVIQKDRFHHSNIYSGAPMPYMQRITWSGIAMHSGPLPGYPASHGCIRMPDGFANKLFGLTKLGMRVVVSPHDVTPTAFAHAALPSPLMTPAPAGTEQAQMRQGALRDDAADRYAQAGSPSATDAGGVVPRLLNPQQRAQFNRTRTRAEAVAAVKRSKDLLEQSQRASADANAAVAEFRAAEAAHAAASNQLAAARSALQQASTPEAQASATQNVGAAETRLADTLRALTAAKAVETVKTPEAFSLAIASREADDAIETTENVAKAAEKAVEPVSVFISRKEGKLMVRQGFVPMFEAPVTFKGQAPLGTHLFVAMNADDSTGKLKWMSVSVPNSSGGGAERTPIKRGQAPIESVGRASSAAEALERLEIPQDVMDKVAERMWLGGSVIVSDLGISSETGKGTDFVVLTK